MQLSSGFLVRLIFGLMIFFTVLSFVARLPFLSDQPVTGRILLLMAILIIMETLVRILANIA